MFVIRDRSGNVPDRSPREDLAKSCLMWEHCLEAVGHPARKSKAGLLAPTEKEREVMMTVKRMNNMQRRKVPSHVFSVALACGVALAAVTLAQGFPERPSIEPGGTNWEPPDPLVIESNGGLTTADLNSGLSPTDVVNALLGTGVTISNVTFSGANHAAGTFAGGTGIIGFESGVVLSSGNIATVVGPNRYDAATTDNSLPGDADLDGLIPGYATHDATVLEFDFECEGTQVVQFQYVFTSEEYNEYVNTSFNDVFGFFLNGTNIAIVPGGGGIATSVNNVNCNNPFNPPTGSFCNLFINNDLSDGGGAINTEMDGLTLVFTATGVLQAGVNHIKLAIADAGDWILDSNVFIKAESFVCELPVGACCDWSDFTCREDVLEVDCQGPDEVWSAGLACGDLDPPCVSPNNPPVCDANGPYTAECAGSMTTVVLDGTESYDPDVGDTITFAWSNIDCPGAYFDDPTNAEPLLTVDSTAPCSLVCHVRLIVTDNWGEPSGPCDVAVMITDTTAPVITSLDGYPLVVAVGYSAIFDAYFTDDCGEPHVATWDFGDGTPPVVTDPATSPTSACHAYATQGIYSAAVTIEDSCGNAAHDSIVVVVYDPDDGFVTGGGWIDSPEGAYMPDTSLTGKASFGFVAKYKKHSTEPDGQTEFQFRVADLNFHSSGYEWLVVTGSDYAMFKGSGTINGEGDYRFRIWAGDSDPDTFRIKIWVEDEDTAEETVIYDNGFDEEIAGGSVQIHKK